MAQPLTQSMLDPMGCETPNCGHDHSTLFLNARCHPGGGLEAEYIKATGELKLSCVVCNRPLTSIMVAP